MTPLLSIRNSAIAVLVMAATHAGMSTWIFMRYGLVIGMVTPVLAIVCGYFLLTLRRYLMEERQKTRIRAMFETYLDRRVVEAMVEDEARTLFGEIGRDHPEDGPTRTYLSRLANEEFLKGLTPVWDGTFTSKEKRSDHEDWPSTSGPVW